MTSKQYPNLEQLFSCYLHEDFPILYSTADKALEFGIAELPPDDLAATCHEMALLRTDPRDLASLKNLLLWELGVCYSWEAGGYTLGQWLAHVDEMLNRRRSDL